MPSAIRRQPGSASSSIQASAASKRCMCGLARCGSEPARSSRNPPCACATSRSSAVRNATACGRHGVAAPKAAMAARESKQREGLIVEIKPRVEHFAVEIDDRRNGAVGADEISGEEIERVLRGVAPRPVPAKPAGLAIGEGLPRDAARAMWPRQRLAVEIDRLAEPAIDAVSPDLPPQRQRDVEQPAPQRRGLAGEIAHATQSLRACGIAVCTAEQVIPGTGERKIPCRQVRSDAYRPFTSLAPSV